MVSSLRHVPAKRCSLRWSSVTSGFIAKTPPSSHPFPLLPSGGWEKVPEGRMRALSRSEYSFQKQFLLQAKSPHPDFGHPLPLLRNGRRRKIGETWRCRFSRPSQVEQRALRVFEPFLDAHQEGHGFLAVDDTVIIGERQIH